MLMVYECVANFESFRDRAYVIIKLIPGTRSVGGGKKVFTKLLIISIPAPADGIREGVYQL